jgi:cupin fold WbuC family metalloprotein
VADSFFNLLCGRISFNRFQLTLNYNSSVMKIFNAKFLDNLSSDARVTPRKRMSENIHGSYLEPCQRLFNAIEPDSYIRPHRHSIDRRDELLIAVRGLMVLILFDDVGNLVRVVSFGSEKHRLALSFGVEVPSSAWHTVISLSPGSVLLEVKAGPFDPERPKEKAPWAPEEGSSAAVEYLKRLTVLACNSDPDLTRDFSTTGT